MTGTQYQEYYEQYLDTLPSTGKSPDTVRGYRLALMKFDDFVKDGEQIRTLTVVNWRSKLAADGVSSNTVRQYLIRLHAFFEWARRMHIIKRNPVDVEEIPRLQTIEYNLLTLDEIQELLSEQPTGIHLATAKRNRAIVVLLLQGGMRNSEIRALRPCDLNFDEQTITVAHGKGDKRRIIAFPALARSVVRDYMNSERPAYLTDADWLFGTDADADGHSTGGAVWHQLSSAGLLRMINCYVEHCTGHKDVCVHALRHAFASLADHYGASMSDVSKVLGHASISTTQNVYVHILNTSHAANTIAALFDKEANV